RPPRPSPFPYTTLFRSNDGSRDGTMRVLESLRDADPRRFSVLDLERNSGKAEAVRRGILAALDRSPNFTGFWDADLATPLFEIRSEEHTSELESRRDLV